MAAQPSLELDGRRRAPVLPSRGRAPMFLEDGAAAQLRYGARQLRLMRWAANLNPAHRRPPRRRRLPLGRWADDRRPEPTGPGFRERIRKLGPDGLSTTFGH